MNYLNKRMVDELEVTGKKILLRCDFNVPVLDGKITDDRRILESLKTIKYLIQNNAKIILCSHFGRPEGKREESLSLNLVALRLSELLGQSVSLIEDILSPGAQETVNSLGNGKVVLLENLRFYKEEMQNDIEFAKKLASLADLFVNDAYGAAHRAHASTCEVAKLLPSAMGFLMKKELSVLDQAINSPKRPLISILGGAKVSDKIGVILALINKVDVLIIGGGMAYTFSKANGHEIGTSLCENDKIDMARDIMKKAKENGVKLLTPIDFVAASSYSNDADIKIVDEGNIPADYMGLDIGPKTIELFSKEIREASGGTVIWNGPMGVCEFSNFANGTRMLAQTLAETDVVAIIGGGDSAAAVEQAGLADKMNHISTGGGASLKLLEGADLPAISVLSEK